jgi:hypothetical protein
VSRILLEDTFNFQIDRAKITESKDPITGLLTHRVPGVLSVCDHINGNRRRYGKPVWEKNLAEGSVLNQMFKRHASFGLLEHPKDGKVDLSSPISHLTTEARLVEKEIDGKKAWVVEGTIDILDYGDGLKLAALIRKGYDPLVSSRGYGTLIKGPDGVDEVQEDYVCEGWDVVSTPSFIQAQLNPQRLSKTNESMPAGRVPAVGELYQGLTIIASKKIPDTNNVELTMEDGSPIVIAMESKDSPAPQKVSAPAPSSVKATNSSTTFNTMDIKQIRESIQSLKAVNPATLDARQFASGFLRMSELHTEAAKHLSENASASWDVGQVHKEISGIEESWVAAFDAPKAEVKKLNENQSKLLKVLKGVTSYSVKVRETLSETAKKATKTSDIAEALAQRGRAWMEAARRETGGRKIFEKKYGVACEALDIMAGRYKGDVAELGSRVIELEFPAITEAHKKSLAEAKTPKAVIAVRAVIEKDLKPTDATKKLAEADKLAEDTKKAEDAKKLAEAAAAAKAPPADPAKKVQESKLVPLTEPQIFRQDVAQVGVAESISMVRRLSQGNAMFHS